MINDYEDDTYSESSHGIEGPCGRRVFYPQGDTFWCEDLEAQLLTHCLVVSQDRYECCGSASGCADGENIRLWTFDS